MIGEYKGVVKNRVVTALLQAYHDCLDYDGMKSILREAGMLELKDIKDINPEETLDFFSFKKIITAQNILLYQCRDLLFEIGKKFSFYLYPFGKEFKEIVNSLEETIDAEWKVLITQFTDALIELKVENCVFCTQVGVPCDLFVGFLVHSLQKSLHTHKKVSFTINKLEGKNSRPGYFILKLKIEKIKINKD